MSQRQKIIYSLVLLMVVTIGAWNYYQRDGFHADSPSDLKLLYNALKSRTTGAGACVHYEEELCFPIVDEENILGHITGHIKTMAETVAPGCITDPATLFIKDPSIIKTGEDQSQDYWKCTVTKMEGPFPDSKGVYNRWLAYLTLTLNLPSSDKQVLLRGTDDSGNSVDNQGEQVIDLEGSTVTAEMIATITPGKDRWLAKTAWQAPLKNENTKDVLTGNIKTRVAYNFENHGPYDPYEVGDIPDPGLTDRLDQNVTADLSLDWQFTDTLDRRGRKTTKTTLNAVNFCQDCHANSVIEQRVTYTYPQAARDTLEDLEGKVSINYKSTEDRKGQGESQSANGKIYWQTATEEIKSDPKSLDVTNFKQKVKGKIARSWNFNSKLKINIFADFVQNSVRRDLTATENLSDYHQDNSMVPGAGQGGQSGVKDEGSASLNVESHQVNDNVTLSGSASRTGSAIKPRSIEGASVCQDGSGSGNNSDNGLTTDNVTFRSKTANLPPGLGNCFNPFAELNSMYLRDLEYYLTSPHTVREYVGMNLSPSKDFWLSGDKIIEPTSQSVHNSKVLPAKITIIETTPSLSKQETDGRARIHSLLAATQLQFGIQVSSVPPQLTRTGQQILDAIGNLEKDSWLIVLGKNPAGLTIRGQTAPAWKVVSMLEDKSAKMTVYGAASCGTGYAPLAESILPLNQKKETSGLDAADKDRKYGIWTNNFEAAAEDVNGVLKQIVGCAS